MTTHNPNSGSYNQQLMLAGLSLLVLLGGGAVLWHFALRDAWKQKPDQQGNKSSSGKANAQANASSNTAANTTTSSASASTSTTTSGGGTSGQSLIDPDEADSLQPQFYNQVKAWASYFHNTGIRKLTEESAVSAAQAIYDAWSWIDDDESAIYKAFKNLNSKADVALVAQAYENLEDNKDDTPLKEALSSGLNEEEYNKVKSIIDSKPNFIAT